MKRLHHIGIAVSNLDEAIALYEGFLGSKPVLVREIPEKQARVAVFHMAGDLEFELLAAARPECDIKEFIDAHGPGVHHLAFAVDNLDNELKSIKESKMRVVDPEPKNGVAGKVVFLDSESTDGVTIEMVQLYH